MFIYVSNVCDIRGGTAAAAPPPFRPSDPALCRSCSLVTPYYCRLGHLLCYNCRPRGRPKVEIPLSVVTESRPKVTYHIRPKPYVPPKVKRYFWPKTETGQSYLSRHDYRSQQVRTSVRCPTIPCIWYLSHLAPCIMSAVRRVINTRPQGPTVPDADADNAAASLV